MAESIFTPQLYRFLDELAVNNNKDWFNPNKQRYEAHVREPARAFVREMTPRLESISEHFVADDRKVGGSLMRVYRDTRFAKDKTPYKTNVGIQFRHSAGKDVHAPGFYVHLSTEECFIGVGMWHPDKEPLAAIRERIAARPDEWRAILADEVFSAHFQAAGESLKRPPRGFDADHPLIDEIKRKDFIATTRLDAIDVLAPDFPDVVTDQFRAGRDYIQFLCDAIGQPF